MALKKQIPFATARALTSTARKIQEAQKDNLQSRLDNPTPFTVNSVASKAARKTNLKAKVLIRPTAAEYLAPEEFGGTRHLGGKALLNPKGVRFLAAEEVPAPNRQEERQAFNERYARTTSETTQVKATGAVW